ncbi:MAG: chromate transporter [Ndongobacter sp.]|nr:chromate transporter [Ndongobacter sp.]
MKRARENAIHEDRQEKVTLKQLFFIFLKINALTFGGGYTIVPVIQDEFVERRRLIDEEEMMNLVALAQSGPGAMAINTSILTGYRIRGPLGALVCLLASVLPCLVIISLLYYVYEAFSANEWVQSALLAMGGTISAVLLVTTIRMAQTALRKHPAISGCLMAFSFLTSFFLHWSTALILLICGLFGLTWFSFCQKGGVV